MHANFSDSNLFPEKNNNITAIASIDELNDNLEPNNFSVLNRSSFDSSTDDLIVSTAQSSITPNLNNSDITVTDSKIQLSSQKNNLDGANFYASDSQEYSSSNGYGLANAAVAVAEVIGEDTFDDVPDKGGKDWGADAVNAPEVWEQGYTGEGVVVAVLDTGVDYNHDDLKNNIWTNSGEIADNGIDDDGNGYIDDFYGWNFDGNNNTTMDVDGHGTHVSGTIAGTNNGFGVTGIAYDSQIMPVKVLDDSGSGTNTSVANGIYYAVDNGADVINLSLGGSSSSSEISAAVEYASNQGVTVVMAAGNSGGQMPLYPARYADEYGIAVGAIDEDKNMASFSNRAGSEELTYVTAPGVDIYSTLPDNKYESYSGTSMATPHIAGVVALMLSANPNLSNEQIRETLKETSSGGSEDTPLFPDFGDIFPGFSLNSNLISGENFEYSSPNKYITRSFSTDFDLSSDINKSANAAFERQFISYEQNRKLNQNNRIFSSDVESMLEEDEILEHPTDLNL
ncbi:MAG: S8 family peptidase [Rivularia sp. (in: cyanobacteria)]